MAYDEGLAERVRELTAADGDLSEKRMFGGIAFMTGGNMAFGLVDDALMARVGPEWYATALQQPHAREFDLTGKPMKGWVHVSAEGIAEDGDLQAWIERGIAYARSLPVK